MPASMPLMMSAHHCSACNCMSFSATLCLCTNAATLLSSSGLLTRSLYRWYNRSAL